MALGDLHGQSSLGGCCWPTGGVRGRDCQVLGCGGLGLEVLGFRVEGLGLGVGFGGSGCRSLSK